MQDFVDPVSGSTHDVVHNPGERTDFHCLVIDQRREDQVNVIGHDDCDLQVVVLPAVVQARLEHD